MNYYSLLAVEYPLPKMDMAAIPDYSSGATEHWGMITFRETNLVIKLLMFIFGKLLDVRFF